MDIPLITRKCSGIQSPYRLSVVITKDDIRNVQADVLLVLANPKLDLKKGNISRLILQAEGEDFQKRVHDACPNELKVGDIVGIGVHKMKFKEVLFGEVNYWKTVNNTESLEKLLRAALKTADDKKFSSIALPAIGTGIPEYPAKIVAQAVFKVVMEYHSKTLKTVTFVVYEPEDVVAEFQKEYERILDVQQQPITGKYCSNEERVTLQKGDKTLTVHVKMGSVLSHARNVDAIVCLEDAVGTGSGRAGKHLSLTDVLVKQPADDGLDLRCKYVIHCHYPKFSADAQREFRNSQSAAIANILKAATKKKIKTLVFPSSGPNDEEVRNMEFYETTIETLVGWVFQTNTTITDIIIRCDNNGTAWNEYTMLLSNMVQ